MGAQGWQGRCGLQGYAVEFSIGLGNRLSNYNGALNRASQFLRRYKTIALQVLGG